MRPTLRFTNRALRDLKRLDAPTRGRLLASIKQYCDAPPAQVVQDQQVGETERSTRTRLLRDHPDEGEVRFSARQRKDDIGHGALFVTWRRAPVPNLLGEDRVDASSGSFHHTGALEGIGQQRVARAWGGDQQIAEVNPFRETAGI